MHATQQDTMKRMADYNDHLIAESNLQDLVDEADKWFSLYVRMSGAGNDGILNCFICDKPVHYTEAENMHYIKRGVSLFLRFDLRNNKAGCNECNCQKGGNYVEYAKKLDHVSPGITDILYEEGNLVVKMSRSELQAIIDEYSTKVKQLKKKIQ